MAAASLRASTRAEAAQAKPFADSSPAVSMTYAQQGGRWQSARRPSSQAQQGPKACTRHEIESASRLPHSRTHRLIQASTHGGAEHPGCGSTKAELLCCSTTESTHRDGQEEHRPAVPLLERRTVLPHQPARRHHHAQEHGRGDLPAGQRVRETPTNLLRKGRGPKRL